MTRKNDRAGEGELRRRLKELKKELESKRRDLARLVAEATRILEEYRKLQRDQPSGQ